MKSLGKALKHDTQMDAETLEANFIDVLARANKASNTSDKAMDDFIYKFEQQFQAETIGDIMDMIPPGLPLLLEGVISSSPAACEKCWAGGSLH